MLHVGLPRVRCRVDVLSLLQMMLLRGGELLLLLLLLLVGVVLNNVDSLWGADEGRCAVICRRHSDLGREQN